MISDGNENRGNLLEQAMTAKSLGVQVDVVPIEYRYDHEVLVEKVSIPPDVKKGETVNINVVIRASEPTHGTLQIFQKADNYRGPADGNQKPVPVELQRGSTSSLSSSSSPRRITTPSRPSSFPTRTVATSGRSTTWPRASRTPGQGPGALDRGDAGRARRADQGTGREGDRGQGAGRSTDRRRRAVSAAISCPPTSPSFSPTTP